MEHRDALAMATFAATYRGSGKTGMMTKRVIEETANFFMAGGRSHLGSRKPINVRSRREKNKVARKARRKNRLTTNR
jgi:hypothetical protein